MPNKYKTEEQLNVFESWLEDQFSDMDYNDAKEMIMRFAEQYSKPEAKQVMGHVINF